MQVNMTVNGEEASADVEPRMLLVHFLRGELDLVQQGFIEEHGLQCGFCTPGMMLTAKALPAANPNPSEYEIREAISGQICRCTGYQNIVKSIQWAAAHQPSPVGEEVRS